MMLAPVALGGAKQRLLPERIPALFFGTAVLAHIIAWAALIIIAPEWPWYAGGPGPVLAAIHVLTLGVLLCTAIGASLQMLPTSACCRSSHPPRTPAASRIETHARVSTCGYPCGRSGARRADFTER